MMDTPRWWSQGKVEACKPGAGRRCRRADLLAPFIPPQTEQQGVSLFYTDSLRPLGCLQVLDKHALSSLQPVLTSNLGYVQEDSTGHDSVPHLVDAPECGLFLGIHKRGRLPVVQLPVPIPGGRCCLNG